jgi:hypothetical protein
MMVLVLCGSSKAQINSSQSSTVDRWVLVVRVVVGTVPTRTRTPGAAAFLPTRDGVTKSVIRPWFRLSSSFSCRCRSLVSVRHWWRLAKKRCGPPPAVAAVALLLLLLLLEALLPAPLLNRPDATKSVVDRVVGHPGYGKDNTGHPSSRKSTRPANGGGPQSHRGAVLQAGHGVGIGAAAVALAVECVCRRGAMTDVNGWLAGRRVALRLSAHRGATARVHCRTVSL